MDFLCFETGRRHSQRLTKRKKKREEETSKNNTPNAIMEKWTVQK